jgi:hypothetical protein
MKFWKKVEEKSLDHWLELDDVESGWHYAVVKWDGCIHYNRYYNHPKQDQEARPEDELSDYLHICDLDEEIERLRELKEHALAHFGEWPR